MSTNPIRRLVADDDGIIEDRFLDLACRTDYARRGVGVGARCRFCGLGLVLVLIPRRAGPVCYRCDRIRRRFGPTEDHHLGGRPSPFLPLPVNANLHRLLSIAQDVLWRGRFEPGSVEAIRIDVTTLFVLGLTYRKEIERWIPKDLSSRTWAS